jgi:hypothetical protein
VKQFRQHFYEQAVEKQEIVDEWRIIRDQLFA